MNASSVPVQSVSFTQRPHFRRLLALAAKAGIAPAAVVYPCSRTAIESVVMARRAGLIHPILIGPTSAIRSMAAEVGLDLEGCEFADTGVDAQAAASKAVDLCRAGRASMIMKGSLHTDELLSVVVRRENALRTSRRVSHVFVLDIPGEPDPLLMSDCVVNVAPTLAEKRDITQSAIDVAHSIGIAWPFVAVLSGVETVNPGIPSSVDAAALSKMAQRGQIQGGYVEGPLSYDVAMSREAARIKGVRYDSERRPDILIVPGMEAGNMLYKQLVHGFKAGCAGIVVGTTVPVICNSRSESPEDRVASCALAAIQRKVVQT